MERVVILKRDISGVTTMNGFTEFVTWAQNLFKIRFLAT